VNLSHLKEAIMRSPFLSLMAAVSAAAILSGTAAAQFRSYYTPGGFSSSIHPSQVSNIGFSNQAYRPSNYGNPGAGPIAGSYAGALTPGSAIPLGSVGTLATLSGAAPLGGGFGTFSVPGPTTGVPFPTNTPFTASYAQPLNAATLMVPNNLAGGPPSNAAAPEAAPGTTPYAAPPANPTDIGTQGMTPANPAAPEAAAGTAPYVAPPINTLANGITATTTTAPANPAGYVPSTGYFPIQYMRPYTAPQYQSSFFEPMRRVYGYQND
jgi:hypothetical protein